MHLLTARWQDFVPKYAFCVGIDKIIGYKASSAPERWIREGQGQICGSGSVTWIVLQKGQRWGVMFCSNVTLVL